MLQYIKTTLTYGNKKYLPDWNRYIDSLLALARPIQYSHFNSYGSSTKGNNLLSMILAMLDLPYIDRHKDDTYLYSNYVRFIENDLDAIFSKFSTGRTYFNMFITKNSLNTQEYLLPVNHGDYIRILPFNSHFNDWTKLRALRLIDHNSNEYTVSLVTDTITFKYNPPTYAVFTIDPIILVFQYKHFLYDLTLLPENRNTLYFIHKYVINPIFTDLIDIWLLRKINTIFSLQTDIQYGDFSNILEKYDISKGNISPGYKAAAQDIFFEKIKLIHGSTKPNDFLFSKTLSYGSINDRIRLLTEDTLIPDLHQYMHFIYLRDRALIKFIIAR